MPLSPGELSGLVAGTALLLVTGVAIGAALRARWASRTERQALSDALAASKAVSEALSEEALFLSAVISAVDSSIVLVDRNERVRFVNERFEETFGIRSSELLNRPRKLLEEKIAAQFGDPQAFLDHCKAERTSAPRATRSSGVPAPDEIEVVLEEPEHRVLLCSTAPVEQGEQRVGMLLVFRDVTAQRVAEAARLRLLAELEARATTDPLTKLANRRAGADALSTEIDRAKRYGTPAAVVLFDIDMFKRINDDFGHEVGDKVLIAFADVLRNTARSTDVVSRWGGEEFLVILHEADIEAARIFAERVRTALAEAAPLAAALGRPARAVTCSAGATIVDGDNADDIVRRADQALYEAKRAGRDRVVVKSAA